MLPTSGIRLDAQMIPPAFMAIRSAVCANAASRIRFPDKTHAAIEHSMRPNTNSTVLAAIGPMKGTSATNPFCCGAQPRTLHHRPWYSQTSAIEVRINLWSSIFRGAMACSSFGQNDKFHNLRSQRLQQGESRDLQAADQKCEALFAQ